jgi:hypothetical protein
LQSWYQCLDCFNCTQESCKNLQSTPFRPIAPFDETKMDPRARHVTYMQITGRKYLKKNEPFTSKLEIKKDWSLCPLKNSKTTFKRKVNTRKTSWETEEGTNNKFLI